MPVQAPDTPNAPPAGVAARAPFQWPLLGLTLAFIIVTGALVALTLVFLRTQAMDAGRSMTQSLSLLVAEQTTRTLQTVDQRLELAIGSLNQLQNDGQLTATSAHTLLKKQAGELPFVRAIWVLDANGRIQYDSDEGNLGVDLSDRAYFQIYKTHPATTFHVGPPVLSRSVGTWLISASRPLWTRTGQLRGVIVAAIEPPYFDQVWRAFDMGPGGSIALLRRDGVLLARAPFDETTIGKSFENIPLFAQHLPNSPNGGYQSTSHVDGVPRIFAYQTLSTQPPMVIVVGESERYLLTAWRRLATITLLVWALAALATGLLAWTLARVFRQRALARADALTQAQRLALATEAASVGVWDWNLHEAHWYGSPTYFSLLGDPPDGHEVLASDVLDRVHPDDQAMVRAKLDAVRAGGGDYHYEARLRHRNGEYRWLRVDGRVLERDASGSATRMVGVRTDITERKLAEQALQESESRHRHLFESSPLPLWVVDLGTTAFVAVNDAALRHYGYSRDEFLGMTLADIRPAEDRSQMMQEVERLRSTAVEHHAAGLWRHCCKDGRVILVEITTKAIVHQGRPARLVLAHDVTAREKTQEALRLSEENLNITLQSIGDAVMVTDTHGLITRMNPAAERLTAWPQSDALGRPLTEVLRIVNAHTRLPANNPVQQVMDSGQVVGLANHTALLARDGREYQIFDSAAPMHDASGQIIGVVLVFSDVTESYRVREALDATTELLERTSELAKMGAWEYDLRTHTPTFSQEALRLHDLDLNLPPPPIEEAIAWYHPEARPVIRAVMAAAAQDGTPFDVELPLVTVKGRALWLRTVGTAVKEGGQIVKVRSSVQDVTARHLAEEAMRASEASLAAAQALAHLGSWSLDLRTQEGIWSVECSRLYYRDPALKAPNFEEFIALNHPDDQAATRAFHERMLQHPGSATRDSRTHPELGPVRVLSHILHTHCNDQGVVTAIMGTSLDVTELRQAERQLQASEAALRESAEHTQSILDNLMDGVITLTEDGHLTSVNQAACAVFGYSPAQIVGQALDVLMPEPKHPAPEGEPPRFQGPALRHMLGQLLEMQGRRQNGQLFPMSLQLSKIWRGQEPVFIGVVRDITQHRQDIEEIRRLAFYDPLTELPNRRLLMDRLRQAMRNSARSQHHGALMFLDLDHFKQLNDTQGHDIGDLLLKQVATRIQHCARDGDSLARLGGDEFVVLLESLSAHEPEAAHQAELIAHKITDAFTAPFTLRGHDYDSSPSIGIVVFRGDADSMDELLKKADVAMYQAKAAGRNTARFYDPAMQAAVAAHDALERELRYALAHQEFVLYFQPQFSGDGQAIGAEALVRWNHPERGLVAPGQFIALAEETGLIQPLGQWVLEAACAQLVTWAQQPDMAHWTLSVNVSAVQFAQADYVATVDAALQSTGANPTRLKLELTESMLANDVNDVVAKMHDLKARGCSLSLDDFGTGYSSLGYLKRMPLDQIKIDQSFVRNVLTDASDAAIITTILALGRSMKLQVIAEGVETQLQRDFLAQHQCDAYQGYYFARPMPAEAIPKFMKENGL